MYGHSEIDLRFTTPIPVHITYQTAFVDESGHLQIREDLYGRDARLLAALKDGPPAGRNPGRAGAAEPQPAVGAAAARGTANDCWSSGQSFFDRLFGNPIQPEPPAQTKQRRASRTTTR